MRIQTKKNLSDEVITQFFTTHWGSTQLVISSGIYDCTELEGFAILNEKKELIGLITYVIRNDECEIISLDSIIEQKGIGSALLLKVEQVSKHHQCKHIKIITTNDNLHALRIYQKRGYQIVQIVTNAVDQARMIKPEIPLVAENGIPIRDELILVKPIQLLKEDNNIM